MVTGGASASIFDPRPTEAIIESIWDDAPAATSALIMSYAEGELDFTSLRGLVAALCRIVRFLDKVQPVGIGNTKEKCWLWTGAKAGGGYGNFAERAVGPNNHVCRQAHRVSYSMVFGAIEEGAHLDHTCRNRSCVNPFHLDEVSPAENLRRGNPGQRTSGYNRGTMCAQGHRFDGVTFRDGKFRQRTCSICMGGYEKKYQEKRQRDRKTRH